MPVLLFVVVLRQDRHGGLSLRRTILKVGQDFFNNPLKGGNFSSRDYLPPQKKGGPFFRDRLYRFFTTSGLPDFPQYAYKVSNKRIKVGWGPGTIGV